MTTSAAVVETRANVVVVASAVVGEVTGAPAEGAAGRIGSVHTSSAQHPNEDR